MLSKRIIYISNAMCGWDAQPIAQPTFTHPSPTPWICRPASISSRPLTTSHYAQTGINLHRISFVTCCKPLFRRKLSSHIRVALVSHDRPCAPTRRSLVRMSGRPAPNRVAQPEALEHLSGERSSRFSVVMAYEAYGHRAANQ